ncbi:RNA recognition domain-containing protein [Ilyonectria destructans]|nr:RNA recognition domain-containing protein [Ilyonectria destructans]
MSADQPVAIAEGRRIYLGNLLYNVRPTEIEEMLIANGFGSFEHIHISVDPVSARNPGYCFVDFLQREDAERAIQSLAASIGNRAVKVGPCNPKQSSRPRYGQEAQTFQRWGDWEGSSTKDTRNTRPNNYSESRQQGPRAALNHFRDLVDGPAERRIYIGGLPKMISQSQHQLDMEKILAGFNPVAVGKRITPHESSRERAGNHYYCFVDFGTAEEAAAAIEALDESPLDSGDQLRVKLAGRIPPSLKSRGEHGGNPQLSNNSGPGERSSAGRSSQPTPAPRAMASSNWRRAE